MSEPTRLLVGPDEPGNEEFGKLMEEFRIRAQLNRADAAHILGVSSEYLRLIERGKRTPALGSVGSMLSLYRIPHEVGVRSLTFGTYCFEFTSRIRETRTHSSDVLRDAQLSDLPKNMRPANRDTQIGQIVRLLTTVDDDTLNEIYKRLRRVQ